MVLRKIKLFWKSFYKVPLLAPYWKDEEWRSMADLFTGLNESEEKTSLKKSLGRLFKAQVIDFNLGRSSIQVALRCFNLKKGDEVILSTYSCRGVIEPIIKEDLTPVFADIDSDYNICPESIEKYITKKTRVIIMTHLFGRPAQIEKIQKIAKKHKLYLIDDAAQVFGLRYNRKMVGTFGDFGIISFGIGKSISATGGGLLIVNNKTFIEEAMKQWTLVEEETKVKGRALNYLLKYKHRRLTAPFYLVSGRFNKPLEYEIKKMSLFDCSLTRKQLARLKEIITKRKKIAQLYDKQIRNDREHSTNDIYTKYVFVSKEGNIREFADYLRMKGIEVEFNYKPLHLNQKYVIYRKNPLPNAEKMWEKNISIPCHPRVTPKKINYIINVINKYYG
jgi:dTDP-4-amino-4,6-dideoxygalactose transaminase